MKKSKSLFFILALTACAQCSNSKKEGSATIEKTIKTFIIYFSYKSPLVLEGESFPEKLQWLYHSYCYKQLEHYSADDHIYKGDIVDGKLIGRVYKKDGSFFEIPLTVSKYSKDLKLINNYSISTRALISYSGEEIRLEVRRVNEKKNEDVLLFEKQILDFNSVNWKNAESYTDMPNGGGFRKASQCHRSPSFR